METITIITPETDDDALSEGLRWLTRKLCHQLGDDGAGGLGGDFGYGVNYENETFAMHRFCWCGGDDCPWCSYSDEDGAHFEEKNRVHGALPGIGDGVAPNFWHKPTGLRVWWYKWIGRDNVVDDEDGKAALVPLRKILTDCLNSVPAPTQQG